MNTTEACKTFEVESLKQEVREWKAMSESQHLALVAALRQIPEIHIYDTLLHSREDVEIESFRDEPNRRTVVRIVD